MKKNSLGHRLWAALLSMVLIVMLMPVKYTYADTNKNEDIRISSVEDLLQMSENCHIDEWSRNKTVILTTDLDLTGVDYVPIPVFTGTFDGKQHVIKGLNYSGNGYVAGLFRYIAEDGAVKNLIVEGIIANTDEKQCIGGICGENAGVISHCEFHGTIDGRSETGGIAGINAATGTIEACAAGGAISGYYSTGGIAGKNHGIIVRCNNRAGVNNSNDWVEEDDENSFDWLSTLRNSEQTASLKSGTDTGGIAGFSDGIISSCTNIAAIGYAHTGYNVGGIAGRQSGMLTLCKNTGRVYGRKDVGGIVGQMEPYIHMDEADSINDSIEKLHALINKMLDDIDQATGTISEDCKQLKSNADAALNTSHDMAGQVSDFVDENVDQVNILADRLRYVIDELPAVQDELMAATDALTTVNSDLKKINEDLAVIDQMKDAPYVSADYARLTLLRSIGGKITTNNNNPAQGIDVTLTVTPDTGYEVEAVSATADGGMNIPLAAYGNGKYVFHMPEQNVVVQAVFRYQGNYLTSSNAGGTVSLNISNHNLKIKAVSDKDYKLESLSIGSKSVDVALFNGNHELTVSQSDYPANEGKPVLITGKFVPQVQTTVTPGAITSGAAVTSYEIHKASSTGGTIRTTIAGASGSGIDVLEAVSGESIRVTAVPSRSNYELNSLYYNNEPLYIYGDEKYTVSEDQSYTFIMPAEEVTVYATFRYKDTAAVSEKIYCESSIGGSITATPVPNQTSKYMLTVTPANDYTLPENGTALYVYEKERDQLLATYTTEQLTKNGTIYNYTLDITGRQTPIRVYAQFVSKEPTHKMTTLSATGGRVYTTQSNAGEGTGIQVLASVEKGYHLKYVGVKYADGTNYYLAVDDGISNFIMPGQDVEIYAEFEPIAFLLTSTPGGSGTYSINEDKVTFTIIPDAGFSLEEVPSVTDAYGNKVNLSKVKANAFVYEFLLHGLTQPITGYVTFCGQNQYDALQSAVDVLDSNSAELSGAMANCESLVNEISSIALDSNGNPVKWENIQSADRDILLKDIISIAQELAKAGTAAANMAGSVSTIANITHTYMVDTATAINKDVDVLTDDLQAVIDHAKAAEVVIDGIMNYLSAQNHIQFSKLGDDFNQNVDALYDQLLAISDSMGRIEQDITDSAGMLNDDFRLINDQMNNVFLLFAEKLDQLQNPDAADYYKDLSDEDIVGTTIGKVNNCINHGSIEGDINIGGVVGIMAIDEEDPEDNSIGKSDFSFKGIYSTKCVLIGCKNYGYITAKKNSAGCVTGTMSLGVAYNCEAYGGAKSSEGDYVGGIAGYSDGIIRNSYALCSLNGESYVGGIAGFGNIIEDCYAMVDANATSTRMGAIAGQVGSKDDADSKEQSAYASHNYYVGDDLYGIDNISYIDVAEPITYDELLTTSGLPSKYRHLTVSFLIDQICVKEQEVAYGEDISDLEFPEIPSKSGQNGVWPELNNKIIDSNLVLEAEFVDNITVLQSVEMDVQSLEGGTVLEKPYAFAEGTFTGKSVLHANMLDQYKKSGEIPGYTDYEVILENTDYDETSELSIRLRNPYDEKAVVYQLAPNGTWQSIAAKARGEYLQIAMTGIRGIYRIEEGAMQLKTKILMGAGCTAGILLILVIFIKICQKAKKRRKARKAKQKTLPHDSGKTK